MKKLNGMFKLSRLRIYLIIYLFLMSLFALTDFWTHFDYAIYKSFYLDKNENIPLLKKITIIEIPYVEEENHKKPTIEKLRERLANLLDEINSRTISNSETQKPDAVIIDFYFPYEVNSDLDGLETLKEAIIKLKDNGVKVFGAYNMKKYYDDSFDNFKEYDDNQIKELYDVFTETRLHVEIENMSGILYYQSLYEIPSEKTDKGGLIGNRRIEALPLKVAHLIDEKPRRPIEKEIHMLLIGNPNDLDRQTYQFTHIQGSTTGGKFSKEINISDKVVIIGTPEGDDTKGIEGITTQYGTQLLAWALNDQISPTEGIVKLPLNNSFIQIGMLLIFPLLVVVMFGYLFKFVKKLQTKPWLLALCSFLIGTVILLFFGYTKWDSGQIIPLGFTLLSMLTISVLSWRFCNKFLVTKIAEGSGKYDVFISYSHAHKDWVKENVYEPLFQFYKANNRDPKKIFFDEKSIGIGEAFTSKYMWGIVDSKHFVPIITDDYYGKSHCQNELDLAYFRTLESPPLIQIYPIAKEFEHVPEIYKHRLADVIEGKKDFMQNLLSKLDNGK